MRHFLVLALAALAFAVAAAQAEPIPVTLDYYDQVGQTTVFRADVTEAALGTISMVTIQDANSGGGSNGVFSGFDLDFLFFDRDGDLGTAGDRIVPLANGATSVQPGNVRDEGHADYLATPQHPGRLFGLLDGNAVDFATATLATRDARFVQGYYLAVNTSHGWVSLGEGGQITVAYPLISIAEGQQLFLFLGDAGGHDELTDAQADVNLYVGAMRICVYGTPCEVPYDIYPGQSFNLDGYPEEGQDAVVSWLWDLDGDGQYDDGTGPVLGVRFDHFAETLGLGEGGPYTVGLLTTTSGGLEQGHTCQINLVPEPTAAVLLLAGAGLLLRKRRR